MKTISFQQSTADPCVNIISREGGKTTIVAVFSRLYYFVPMLRFILEHVLKKSSPVRLVCIPVILVLFIFKLYATCSCSVLSLIF